MKKMAQFLIWSMFVTAGLCPAMPNDNPEPTLLQAEISGVWVLFVDPSPTPVCGVGPWDVILAENESYYFDDGLSDEPCISGWNVHCNSEGMGFKGWWTTDDPNNPYWNFSTVNCEMTAEIYFPEKIRILVQSSSEGVLETNHHEVKVLDAAGNEWVVFGPDPGGAGMLELPAGQYTISILVDVREQQAHQDFHTELNVRWESQSGVGNEFLTIGGLKSMYR